MMNSLALERAYQILSLPKATNGAAGLRTTNHVSAACPMPLVCRATPALPFSKLRWWLEFLHGVRNFQKAFLLVAAVLASSAGTPCNAATPNGDDIAHQGVGTVPACTGCHGPAFQGQPAIKAPALAGLPSGFIIARLAHYAGPTGHNATMRAVAQGLTNTERQAVAEYLATLPKALAKHNLKDPTP